MCAGARGLYCANFVTRYITIVNSVQGNRYYPVDVAALQVLQEHSKNNVSTNAKIAVSRGVGRVSSTKLWLQNIKQSANPRHED
jgi:hypothetical protein